MRVVQVAPDFGLGGVQKAACLVAKYLAKQGHETWVLASESGPRFETNSADGVQHEVAPPGQLVSRLEAIEPDVIHVHAGNYKQANLDPLLASSALSKCVKVVTPVFGRPPENRSVLEQVKTCCVGLYTYYRLLRWLSLSAEQACARGMIYAPLTPFEPPASGVAATQDPSFVAARRESLGVPADSLVIGRVGRNALGKWPPRTRDIIHRLLSRFSYTAWLSVGMPAELGVDELKAQWGPRFTNLNETPDYDELCAAVSCFDFQFFMSRYGECFASSICDPAGLGVPTFAVSTPLNDNGQAEQVIDGVTGHLLGSLEDAEPLIDHYRHNPQQLVQLKQTTQQHTLENWHAAIVAQRLESAYQHWLAGGVDAGPLTQPIVEAHQEFARTYADRVTRIAAGNPFSRVFRRAALRASECYPLHTVSRKLKRLVKRR